MSQEETKKTEEPKVEEVKKEEGGETTKPAEEGKITVEDAGDDDLPPLETAPAAEGANAAAGAPATAEEDSEAAKKAKQSRSEKKSRKAVQKLGLKPVPGIVRVTVKKAKNVRLTPPHPIATLCEKILFFSPVCFPRTLRVERFLLFFIPLFWGSVPSSVLTLFVRCYS